MKKLYLITLHNENSWNYISNVLGIYNKFKLKKFLSKDIYSLNYSDLFNNPGSKYKYYVSFYIYIIEVFANTSDNLSNLEPCKIVSIVDILRDKKYKYFEDHY